MLLGVSLCIDEITCGKWWAGRGIDKFEIIAFDMEGGAGSQNTSGERLAQAIFPRDREEWAHQLGQCGDVEDTDGLPGQPPALQRQPLSC